MSQSSSDTEGAKSEMLALADMIADLRIIEQMMSSGIPRGVFFFLSDSQRNAVVTALRNQPAPAQREGVEPCPYCLPGMRTGLPGNACENCMNTGLKNPTSEDIP